MWMQLQLPGDGPHQYKSPVAPSISPPYSFAKKMGKEKVDECLEKIDAMVFNVDDISLPEEKQFQTPSSSSTFVEETHKSGATSEPVHAPPKFFFDEGLFFDLMQKTTKLKNIPLNNSEEKCKSEQKSSNSEEKCSNEEKYNKGSGLQFLYGEEDTNSTDFEECLERLKLTADSTCTCKSTK